MANQSLIDDLLIQGMTSALQRSEYVRSALDTIATGDVEYSTVSGDEEIIKIVNSQIRDINEKIVLYCNGTLGGPEYINMLAFNAEVAAVACVVAEHIGMSNGLPYAVLKIDGHGKNTEYVREIFSHRERESSVRLNPLLFAAALSIFNAAYRVNKSPEVFSTIVRRVMSRVGTLSIWTDMPGSAGIDFDKRRKDALNEIFMVEDSDTEVNIHPAFKLIYLSIISDEGRAEMFRYRCSRAFFPALADILSSSTCTSAAPYTYSFSTDKPYEMQALAYYTLRKLSAQPTFQDALWHLSKIKHAAPTTDRYTNFLVRFAEHVKSRELIKADQMSHADIINSTLDAMQRHGPNSILPELLTSYMRSDHYRPSGGVAIREDQYKLLSLQCKYFVGIYTSIILGDHKYMVKWFKEYQYKKNRGGSNNRDTALSYAITSMSKLASAFKLRISPKELKLGKDVLYNFIEADLMGWFIYGGDVGEE